MKRNFVPALAFTLMVYLCGASAAAQGDVITILHMNDTHSCLEGIGPRDAALHTQQGGIARAASMIGSLRAQYPDAVLLHAGDLFIGDLFFNTTFGVAEFGIMKELGFDAMTVGNHEFDLTPDILALSLSTAFPSGGFPLLSANLGFDDPAVAVLKNFISPSTIITRGVHKIGVFGMTTPSVATYSFPGKVTVDTAITSIAAAMVQDLKAQGCDVILFLSHLGVKSDRLIAANVAGIHAIIGGHDHITLIAPVEIVNPDGGTTWIVQANAFSLGMGQLQLRIDAGNVTPVGYSYLPLDASVPNYPPLAAMVDTLKAGIEATYGPVFSQQIAEVSAYFDEFADSLLFAGNHDTPVGNLVTDALRTAMNTDIAIEVGGSTSQPLYPGPIVAADLFRAIGYGFNTDNGLGYRVATFDISGLSLLTGLEFTLSGIEADDELLIQASGLNYSYNPVNPPYGRITGATVGGQPLDPGKTYTVASNEFIAGFLQYLGTMIPGITIANVRVVDSVSEFQVLAQYCQGRILTPSVEGRVRCDATVGIEPGRAVVDRFSLQQNYPNPFHASTVVRFELATSAAVRVSVFDLSGSCIATLVDGTLPAGSHERIFDAHGLARGTYVVALSANGRHAFKAMILR